MSNGSVEHSQDGSRAQGKSGSGRVAILDQALWKRLAEGETLQSTLDSWLAIQCGMIPSVTQGVLALGQDDAAVPFLPAAIWPEGSNLCKSLASTAELVVSRQSGIVRKEDQAPVDASVSYLGYPLRIEDELLGVVAVRLEDGQAPDLKQAMRLLQLGAGWFEALSRRERARQQTSRLQREELALALIQNVLNEPDFETACIACVNELAATLKCERVSLGFLQNNRVKVSTLSHTVQVDSKLSLLNAVAAAMDEALDQESVIVEPPTEADTATLVSRAQRLLISDHDSGHVVTAPFSWRGKQSGAFTFERSKGNTFSEEDIKLCETVADQLGPLLEEHRRESRWFGARMAENMVALLGRLFGRGHLLLKTTAIVLLLLTTFLIFARDDYRVAAPAYLKGEVQRVIAAPFDGYIAEAEFRAGDTVKKGDIIALLDDRELMLERIRWTTQRRQHVLEYDQALGDQKRSEVGVIRARIKQAESQIELIDAQLKRSRLTAPFDGILVSGDLSQSIGGAVRKGDTLFELVPLGNYRIVLNVDESDIRYIAESQEGGMVLTSLPETSLPLKVSKITPVSKSEEGRNYFEVEAQLLGDQILELRPGMEGIAKVTTEEQRQVWIWTHRFSDWIKLQYWSLWP